MKRKIIKQGHNTLTITLPASWASKMNIKPGNEVSMVEREGGLFISTEKVGEEKHAEFDISALDIPTIWKYFMAVYREGYNEVRVTFQRGSTIENPFKFFTQYKLDRRYKREPARMTILDALQLFASRFVGFEIVEHGKDYIIIREMGELTNKEFDNSLRRVFLLIQQMTEEVLEALNTNNPSLLIHTHDVDINIDKFQDYCIRILHRIGNKGQKKTSLYFATLYLLELIGDEYKNVSYHLIYDFKRDKKFNKFMAVLADFVKKQFDAFYELFYSFEPEKIKVISDIDMELYFNVTKMYRSMNDDEKEIFHHLRMVEKYINALLELRVEMQF